MKTYSKKELEKLAQKVFEQYPTSNQVFATVDGNIFLHKNRAELHSKDTIYTFDRPGKAVEPTDDTDSTGSDTKVDYREAIKAIKEAETLEAIKPFAEDDRKSVKAAYDAKKKELEAAEAATKLQEDLKTIETAETLADIEAFEADERAEVQAAYEAKKAELIKDLDVKE